MNILIKAVSFLTAFLLLACTITAISAAMYEEPERAIEETTVETQSPTEAATLPPATESKLTEVPEHLQNEDEYKRAVEKYGEKEIAALTELAAYELVRVHGWSSFVRYLQETAKSKDGGQAFRRVYN